MKHRAPHGFTLVEVLAVIVIILIIAGWILAAFGSANTKAARARADAEIKLMSTACESFKADFGSYPRLAVVTEAEQAGGTPPIDPRKDGNPTAMAYTDASAFLYKALSGDADLDGKLTPPDEPSKGYMHFENRLLRGNKDANGRIIKVICIQDPFGNSYGYSTAAAKAEEDLKADIAAKGDKAARDDHPVGFNPNFDLWSTGGKILTGTPSDLDRNSWVKNW